MNFWILILLAIIQGLTEFLPISSSGHLVLLYDFFCIENNIKLLSILLHIATLFSVLVYYKKDILQLIKKPFCNTNKKITVTTITTCLTVLALRNFIDSTFNGEYIFVFFLITAILLLVSDYLVEKNNILSRTIYFKTENMKLVDMDNVTNISINYKQAVIIGLTQGIACIPGISRSGSTIAVARICKCGDVARYSFLISIPIIIMSLLLELFEGGLSGLKVNIGGLIIAMIVCFGIGLLCIKLMTNLVNKNKLSYFSYYLIAISTLLVVLSFI